MWWIASELVRRHPHLRISGAEVDEGDRLLIVHDEQDGMSIQWDLVGGCSYMVNGEDCDYFGYFPTAVAARTAYEDAAEEELDAGRGVYFFKPFWAVLRDLEPVAIVDAAGVIHYIQGENELMPIYENIHRNLCLTTAQLLGPYLH